MVTGEPNYKMMADNLDKSLDMFGVKSLFNSMGISKEEWIKNLIPKEYKDFAISNTGKIIMPNLNIV